MRQAPAGGPAIAVPPGGGPQGGSPLFRAYRYALDHPAFAGRKVVAGKTLEDLQPKEPEKKGPESKK
jgi:hypothetical protein